MVQVGPPDVGDAAGGERDRDGGHRPKDVRCIEAGRVVDEARDDRGDREGEAGEEADPTVAAAVDEVDRERIGQRLPR